MAGPTFLNADLLGDSTMLHFSLKHADFIPDFPDYPTSWGVCRRDLTANQLLVQDWNAGTAPGWNERAAVIMTGTNDLLRVSQLSSGLARKKKAMRFTLKKIKDKAVRRYKRVYLCTVPEIPRLEDHFLNNTRERYCSLLKTMNADIVKFGERYDSVVTVDLRGCFDRDCYEGYKETGGGILFNAKDLPLLREILGEKLLLPQEDSLREIMGTGDGVLFNAKGLSVLRGILEEKLGTQEDSLLE